MATYDSSFFYDDINLTYDGLFVEQSDNIPVVSKRPNVFIGTNKNKKTLEIIFHLTMNNNKITKLYKINENKKIKITSKLSEIKNKKINIISSLTKQNNINIISKIFNNDNNE